MSLSLTNSAPSATYEPAGFAVRGLALVYELLIVAAILFIAAAIPTAINRAAIAPGTIWFELWLAACVFAYFGYCWTRSGQTVAMRAWQLLLTDLDGRRVSWRTALLRWLMSTLLGFGIIGWLAMLVDRDTLALQDRLSKTRVLQIKKLSS